MYSSRSSCRVRDNFIQRRLHDVAGEIRNYSLYDYVLVNRDVAASVDTLVSIVKATRSRRHRMENEIRPIRENFRNARH
jgi:guanylate kinase